MAITINLKDQVSKDALLGEELFLERDMVVLFTVYISTTNQYK